MILLLSMAAMFLIFIIVMIVLFRFSNRRNDEKISAMRKDMNEKAGLMSQMNMNLSSSISSVETSLNRELLDFYERMNRDFDDLNERTSGRILHMEERISRNIQTSNERSSEVFSDLKERMARLDETQKEFLSLSQEISSLQNILQDKKTRGIFGEIELYSLLENVLGQEGILYRKQVKLSNGCIADAVVEGGEKIGKICIDSKFPLENYRRMYNSELSKQDRDLARRQFEGDVRKHIGDIRLKYLIKGETAETAYMFIPAEAVYSEIYANYDALVDLSYRSKVLIVSPTTLVAYLTAIKSIYLGLKKDEKAEEIRALLVDLSKDFKNFSERTGNLSRHFNDLEKDFHDIENTGKKILKKFAMINDGEFQDEKH